MTCSVSPSQEAWNRPACQTPWPLGNFGSSVLACERILGCRERVLMESASAVCVCERNWTGHSAHRSTSCLVGMSETSLHEHLSSAWSSHISMLGELTHSSASTGTNKTWRRDPGWRCVGTACLIQDLPASLHLYCEPWFQGRKLRPRGAPRQFSSVATPWTAHQASLSITNSQSLLKLMSTESVMASNHLILCCLLLLLPSIFPSIRVFSNESVLHIRWS